MLDQDKILIGVDLGGTKILAGRIRHGAIEKSDKRAVPKAGTKEQVLQALYATIDQTLTDEVAGIGIGVPSVVDAQKGIVYDVQNIPSWRVVHLKDLLEEKYQLSVFVNNDANCFALGEQYFGKGRSCGNFAALIIGTGLAAGLVIHHQLYNGHNCGAGEFGMIPYLDQHYEYYCSGQFFENQYQLNGLEVFQRASAGEQAALEMFAAYGTHLGQAMQTILLAFDPELIILGGSVSQSYPFFRDAMWQQIRQFPYRTTPERLRLEVSDHPDVAVLGAAALCYLE